MRVVIRDKGRLTLPAPIREALGVREGDELEVSAAGATIILRPTKIVTSAEMKGILGRMKVDIEEAEEALGREAP